MTTLERTTLLQASNPQQFVAAVEHDPLWNLVYGPVGDVLRPRILVAFYAGRAMCAAAIFEDGKAEIEDFNGDWIGRREYVERRRRHAKL